MSVSSYTTVDDMMRLFGRVIQTARLTPDDVDFHIQIAEGEVNGSLARRYAVPFSVSLFPVEPVRTITILFSAHSMLRTQITQEDPSQSDWVRQLREQGERLLQALVDGTADILSGSGQVIGTKARAMDRVWSSTAGYVPTRDVRDPIEQRYDPTRLQDLQDRDKAQGN